MNPRTFSFKKFIPSAISIPILIWFISSINGYLINEDLRMLSRILFSVAVVSTSVITYHLMENKIYIKYLSKLFLSGLLTFFSLSFLFVVLIFSFLSEAGFSAIALAIGIPIALFIYFFSLLIFGATYPVIGRLIEDEKEIRLKIAKIIIFAIISVALIVGITFIFTDFIPQTIANIHQEQGAAQAKKELGTILEPTYLPAVFTQYKKEEFSETVDSKQIILTTRYFCDKSRNFNDGYLDITQALNKTSDEDYFEDSMNEGLPTFDGFHFEDAFSENLVIRNKHSVAFYGEANVNFELNSTGLIWGESPTSAGRTTMKIISYKECVQPKEELVKIANSIK